MGWSIIDNKANYDGSLPSQTLYQTDVLIVGKYYYVELNATITQGQISFYGFENIHTFNSSDNIIFVDKAIGPNISITPEIYLGSMFVGDIELISVVEAPTFEIKENFTDIVVFTQDGTLATLDSMNYLTQQIDWSTIGQGCYYLEFESDGITYKTDVLSVRTNTDCTLLLDWYNNENAFGFNFETFRPKWRGVAKVWKQTYEADRNEYYTNSRGQRIALYVRSIEKNLLTINEVPRYVHSALRLALKSDFCYINNKQYVQEEAEYTPTWRNSSSLAPVEVEILLATQNTVNANCI